jgi:DedD protein
MEMARAISDEELQLRKRARRRLIGAIVIVTAVVVALPMVLDNEPKPLTQDIDIRIPSPESAGPFTSKVVPVPQPPSEKPQVAAKPAPGAETKAVPTQSKPAPGPSTPSTAKPDTATPAETTVKQAAPKPEKTAVAPKPEQQEARAPAAGQYVVQVVALSDAGKAKQMQQAILKTGVSSYTEIVKTARGDVTRVRAGPFTTREAAEKAQQKLKSAGFDGKIVPTR